MSQTESIEQVEQRLVRFFDWERTRTHIPNSVKDRIARDHRVHADRPSVKIRHLLHYVLRRKVAAGAVTALVVVISAMFFIASIVQTGGQPSVTANSDVPSLGQITFWPGIGVQETQKGLLVNIAYPDMGTGFQVGDIIQSIDGKKITGVDDFISATSPGTVNRTLLFSIERNGAVSTFSRSLEATDAGTAPPNAAGPEPSTAVTTITDSDNGKTIRLTTGAKLRLNLNLAIDWKISTSDSSVLSQSSVGDRFGQGEFVAVSAGEATLVGSGNPRCIDGVDCPQDNWSFRIVVDVEK
jgi:hypothetical protein